MLLPVPQSPLLRAGTVRGVTPSRSTCMGATSRGIWLRSAGNARLRLLHADTECTETPFLEIHVGDRALLHAPLCKGALQACVLKAPPPLHCDGSNARCSSVLALWLGGCSDTPAVYCFRFWDAADCTNFVAAVTLAASACARKDTSHLAARPVGVAQCDANGGDTTANMKNLESQARDAIRVRLYVDHLCNACLHVASWH